MFKKELKVSANHQLQKSDVAKLREDLLKMFDNPSVIQFAKAYKKIVQLKIQGKNGGTQLYIYTNDEYPILVDPSKKGDYFPTVYTCTALPDLIPSIYLNKGVEEYLYKGAQLMWPGVKNIADMGPFQNDDLRRIVSHDGTVVGIGAMSCSSEDVDQQNSSEGVCCMVLHHNKDKLYEMGEDKIPQVIWSHEIQKKQEEDERRIKEEVEEIKRRAEQEKLKNAEQGGNDDGEEDDEDDIAQMASYMNIQKKSNQPKIQYETKQKINHFKEEEEQVSSKVQKGKKGKAKKVDDDEEPEENEQEEEPQKKQDKGKKTNTKGKQDDKKEKEKGKGKEKEKKQSEQIEDDQPTGTQDSNVNVKEIDAQIKEAFLNAVKLSVEDKMLPMDPTVLYNQHMQNCKGSEVKYLDFKNSSWKKIGVFMNYLKKEKFIEYKEGKKGAAPMIQTIFRQHKEIEDWEITIGKVSKKEEDKDNEKDQDHSIVSKVAIEEFFRPGIDVAEIFGGKDSVKKEFTQSDIQKHIQEYIKKNCTIEKKNIVLDPYLAKLFPPEEVSDDEEEEEKKDDDDEEVEEKKPKKPKNLTIVNQVTKERLGKKIESKLQVVHTITNLKTGEKKSYNGPFKGIQVITEKIHNKNVTRVVGLEQFGIDLESLAGKFQLQFACSCTTHESHTKGAGKDLQIQGNNLSDVVEFLEKQSKIEKRFIKEQDKLNAKKKVKGFQK